MTLAAAGCWGGEDGGGFCSTFQFAACGGDVVGAWTARNFCPSSTATSQEPVYNDACAPTNAIKTTTLLTGVEMTFNADGTFTRTTSTSARTTATLDRACADAIAAAEMPGATLETLCPLLENELGLEGATGSCSISGDVCSCSFSGTSSEPDQGSYVVNGSDLALSTSITPVPFCVQGDQLSMLSDSPLQGQAQMYMVFGR